MKKIDLNNWDRKGYFDFFTFSDIPQFSLTYNIDVTNLLRYTKEKGLSFYCAMVYAVVKSMQETEALCYRIHKDGVYLYDEILPSFTFMNKGDTLFKMVTVPVSGTIDEYAQKACKIAQEQEEYLPKTYHEKDDNYTYISCIPWISYTGCESEAVIDKNDAIPRVTWGKYFTDFNGKIMMPFSIRVNHRVVNGYDIALFNDKLQGFMDSL